MNEISVVQHTGRQIQLLFLLPIPDPRQINGVNVIDTHPSGIPAVGHISVITEAEHAALLGGTLAYELHPFEIDPEIPTSQMVAHARSFYVTRNHAFPDEYAARWKFLGARVNAPDPPA